MPSITEGSTLWWVAYAAVLVLGVARLGRLLTYDDYPPLVWLRAWWLARAGESWGKLLTCMWCADPYLAAIAIGWSWVFGVGWAWWVLWGWLAASQVASTLSAYDEPGQ